MAWHPKRSLKELTEALADFDFDRAAELVAELGRHLRQSDAPYPQGEAEDLLTELRRSRQFELLRIAADALIQSGNGAFRARIEYAQALTELGALSASRAVLEDVLRDAPPGNIEREARGQLGRSFKQQYIDAAAPHVGANVEALRRAMRCYLEVYAEDRSSTERWWHGINAIALAARAARDQVALELDAPFDVAREASALVAAIERAGKRGEAKLWHLPTALEACLALEDRSPAIEWARRYVKHPDVRAFEIASTLRQLQTVWRLSSQSELGAELIPLLETKLLTLRGTRLELDASTAGVEKRQQPQGDDLVAAEDYRLGLSRTLSIARIVPRDAERALKSNGTGVLVRGSDLHPRFGDECVLLTCAHVVAEPSAPWAASMRSPEARVELLFGRDAADPPFSTEIEKVLWQSIAVDACVLRLRALPKHAEPCPVRTLTAADESSVKRVFIAGYPVGHALTFSLYDNLVIGQSDTTLQYRAATKVGSSGSPVFDLRWQMLALHQHGGSMRRLDGLGFHTANQGTLVSAIIDELARDLTPG